VKQITHTLILSGPSELLFDGVGRCEIPIRAME
jgi:hypothetical protein